MPVSKSERDILRTLAAQCMEIAALPEQKETIRLWRALNSCEMQRPMVTIDQCPWHELNDDDMLKLYVQDPVWRAVEQTLRRTLYRWKYFPVDMVVDPFVTIPRAITSTGFGLKIEEKTLKNDAENDISSHRYVNLIREEEDIEKIKDIDFIEDTSKSALIFEEAKDIFDGCAPIRASHGVVFNVSIWDRLAEFMTVDDIYMDMAMRPEFIHKIVERMTEATLAGIRKANEMQIHDDNALLCHCSYVFTDDLLPEPGQGKGPVSKNCWVQAQAQPLTCVSPDMTDEFEIPYAIRLCQEFAYTYYGCCERLDDRMDYVKQIPNLRKIACSPWSDVEHHAEQLGRKYIMSNKPNPAPLAVNGSYIEACEEDLGKIIGTCKRHNTNLEILLKDISTVNYQPQRLTEWAQSAMRMVNGW